MWNLGRGWKSTHWPGTKLKEDVIGVELSWIILSVRPVVTAGESCLRDCMVARCHVMGWSLLASYHRGSEESSGGWRQSSLEKKSFSFSSLPPSPTPSTSQLSTPMLTLTIIAALSPPRRRESMEYNTYRANVYYFHDNHSHKVFVSRNHSLTLTSRASSSISISIYYNYNGHLQKI